MRRHIVNRHELDRSYFAAAAIIITAAVITLTTAASVAAAKIEGCFTTSLHLNGDWTHI
jgi:hypothetical protein